MTRRHPDEVVVARWTVDGRTLRDFAGRMRARYGDTPFAPADLLAECDANASRGLEVVCRDDAVFVGSWCLAFLYNDVSAIRLQDTWLQFEMEGGLYEIPVPLARGGRDAAARAVAAYERMGEEEARRAREARQAPTWSNRLLDIAEAHFVLVALGLFFVAIPLLVLVIVLLGGGSG